MGLRIHAEAQQRVGCQVGFDDAVEDVLALVEAIDVRLVVLVDTDQAAAQRAIVVQRAGNVRLGTGIVPTADVLLERGLELGGRPLADHVQSGAGGAHAVGQAGGAADDLHAVVQRHVSALGDRFVVAIQALHAIDLVVLHHEAAGVDQAGVGAGVTALVDVQAGGLLDHVHQLREVLVLHTLPGDHADRLRRFADRQRQLGGGGGRAAGVGAGALGGGAEADAVDAGGAEFHGIAAGPADDQRVAALLVAQAAAGEQAGERFQGFQLAADRRGAQALDQAAVDGDGQAGGFAELAQRGAQRLGRQVEVQRCGQGMAGEGEGHGGRQGAQGRLHRHGEHPSERLADATLTCAGGPTLMSHLRIIFDADERSISAPAERSPAGRVAGAPGRFPAGPRGSPRHRPTAPPR
ncbi:hypothetical protein D9M69_377540 [compost metagenome]